MENELLKLKQDLLSGTIAPKQMLMGGMMNKSFIFDFKGKEYVCYIPTEQANEMVDRILERDVQKIVYNLGLTSKNLVFYDDGFKINEFIRGESLNHIDNYDVKEVAKLLHKLHDAKVKCSKDYYPYDAVKAYEKEALGLGIEFDPKFHELLNLVDFYGDFLANHEKILCHNDFQKSNILKSNDNHYYMIDFEFMMNNDPYFDIAGFGNNAVKEGYELLEVYCGDKFGKDDIKRYCLYRILLSLQWYTVALIKDVRGEGKVHGYDFKQVALMFLNNALDARALLKDKVGI